MRANESAKEETMNPMQPIKLPQTQTIRHPYLFVKAPTIGPTQSAPPQRTDPAQAT